MPPHTHHNISSHLYPIIPPHQVYLRPLFTSTTTYATYVVTQYPHTPPLYYLHTSSSRPTSSVFNTNSKEKMSEYISKRRNIISNENKKRRKPSMSRRDGFNYDLVSVSIDGSHEYMGWHKGISFYPPPPPKPTAELTSTSSCEHYLVDTNDEQD